MNQVGYLLELGPTDANFTGVRNVTGPAFRAARRGIHD